MKAYELLNTPDKWCKESLALTKDGEEVLANDPNAVKFCIVGAIQKCYLNNAPSFYFKLLNYIDNKHSLSVGMFNDLETTTYEDVYNLLRELNI